MTPAEHSITHESEIQRQHVRLPLPVKAEIDGKVYRAANISSSGLSVQGIEGDYRRGSPIKLSLKIPFGTFSLDVNLEAEAQYYDPKKKNLGCRFLNPTGSQVSLFNYILKSFMAGDIVAANDLLNVVSRDNFIKAPRPKDTAAPVAFDIRQIAGLAMAGVLGLSAMIVIVSNIYQGLFFISAADAAVRSSVIDISAPAEGIFNTALEGHGAIVRTGQIIANISSLSAATASPNIPTVITSPCDCSVVENFHHDGEIAAAGEKLFSLVPADAKPWIEAEIAPLQASKIRINGQTQFTITGSNKKFTGRISQVKSGLANPQPQNIAEYFPRPVQIYITPDQQIPPDLTGRPARVKFRIR